MRFEKEPPRDRTIDLTRSLEAGFDALERLGPADLNRLMGKHLTARRLQSHAEGRVDFAAARDENFHLSLCDICSDEVLRLERDHLTHLRADQGKVVAVSAEEVLQHAADRKLELIRCRSLGMDLIVREGALFLEIEADDIPGIDRLRITHPVSGKNLSFAIKLAASDRLEISLGPVQQFSGERLDISFDYQGESWCKAIRID
jgi:hypothetical protein